MALQANCHVSVDKKDIDNPALIIPLAHMAYGGMRGVRFGDFDTLASTRNHWSGRS